MWSARKLSQAIETLGILVAADLQDQSASIAIAGSALNTRFLGLAMIFCRQYLRGSCQKGIDLRNWGSDCPRR